MHDECEFTEVAEGPSVCSGRTHHPSATRRPAAYGIKIWIDMPHGEVLATTKRVLSKHGIQIANEIDVRKLLQSALDIEFPHYTILAVYKPEWIRRALELDRDMGLLLPTSIVVYEQDEGSILEALDVIAEYAIARGREIVNLARDIKQSLDEVLSHVSAGIE